MQELQELFGKFMDGLQWLVQRMAVDAVPEPLVILAALVLLTPAVAFHPTWVTLRHGVTIIHEMGHVIMGWLWGRRIDGISLHTDTSGLTISAGKPYGLGVLMTFLSGYTAPPLVGLAMVWAGLKGWAGLAMTLLVLILIAAFWLVRNPWGLVTVALSLGATGFIFWQGNSRVISTTVVVIGVFLLMAGLRGGFDLWSIHARGQGSESDASMASRHSLIPAMVWVWFFAVFGFVCGLFAAYLIIGALV